MFKDFNTIKYLRKLSEKEVNNGFLASLRTDLTGYMKANPAPREAKISLLSNLQFFNMKYATIALIVIVAVMSGGGVTLASFGSLPGDRLYPVKTFSEDMRSLLAFTPEAKQRLEEKLAAKRIAEIEELMAKPELNQANVDIALSRLDKHMDDVAKIVEMEKKNGKDVSEIAKKIGENFNSQQDVLEKVFQAKEVKIKERLDNMEGSLEYAEKTGDATTTEKILKELHKIDALKDKVIKFRNGHDNRINDRNPERKIERIKETERQEQIIKNKIEEDRTKGQFIQEPKTPEITKD